MRAEAGHARNTPLCLYHLLMHSDVVHVVLR